VGYPERNKTKKNRSRRLLARLALTYCQTLPDIDQPLSGGSDHSCSNLETVLVP
jgi:hypothetical protein